MDHDPAARPGMRECEDGEDLIQRLEPLVRSVVARFARDRTTADELAQACRIRIYEKRRQLRDPEAVFGWAWKLCHRVCVTAVEQVQRDRYRLVQDEDRIASTPASVQDPLAAAETGEIGSRIARALQRLPVEQRRLLTLRYWHGLSASDIGSRLNLPSGTVRTRLRRACLRLRRAPEIVCYAPRRPSLWSRRSREANVSDPPHSYHSSRDRGAS